MRIESSIIIGLTGSFGSGCSTLATALEDIGFKCFSLSDIVRDEWKRRYPNIDVDLASRCELQDIGNELREKNGDFFLAREIFNQAEQKDMGGKYLFSWNGTPRNYNTKLIEFLKQNFNIDWVRNAKIEKIDNIKTIKVSTEKNYLSLKLNDEQTEVRLEIDDGRTDKFVVKNENCKLNIYGKKKEGFVFDSIRNVAEVKWFQDHCPNFYLIAVDCSHSIRWERVKEKNYYKLELKESNFEEDDIRDKNEKHSPHGQQVQLCVYEADIVINNDNNYPNKKAAIKRLKDKVNGHLLERISENRDLKVPRNDEFCMTMAYCASLMSKCIKRQVGAVIVDMNNVIVSIGYNQNTNHKSCYDAYGDCYREIYKEKNKKKLSDKCSNPICGTELLDKALSKCRALHAEEMALMNIGIKNLEGYTLYTTTYPCLICARKIAYSGIKKIVYVEAYTDPESEEYIKESGIEAIKFEGIKARAYFRLFSSSRSKIEEELNGSRKAIDFPKVIPICVETKPHRKLPKRLFHRESKKSSKMLSIPLKKRAKKSR
jgi:deoxycytidylate deaminase